MAKELGFDGLVSTTMFIGILKRPLEKLTIILQLWNSMGAVSSRDFVLEALQFASTVMIHISR
jgi:argininosuccinate lyase